ncbi:UTRA domain-containing protein [Pediococcus ethanolidurans]|uniref:GntR family transcriptional regulator n=1 Tax=Pediococcus ethanolidurans TaxID=319653 RepID=UPI002954D32E|nr:GntR family transcriptional regulator [Pediococcus ethanolidurans]MDV7719638.1 UTRA domain-containing protein [Pediococcus ethanolidurans]
MKYMLVVDHIRKGIETGQYSYGKKMPTINELAKKLSVSAMTVKKGLDIAQSRGYIERRQGSGIYVKMNTDGKKKSIPLSGNSSRFSKSDLRTKIIHFSVDRPSKEAAKKLQIPATDFVYNIERVRILKNKPIIIEYVYMPINVIPGLTEKILENSIYEYIRHSLNKKISSSDFLITGVRPNKDDKKFLNLTDKDFLMQIIQTVYLDDGTAFEYSIDKHLPEVFEYRSVETDI